MTVYRRNPFTGVMSSMELPITNEQVEAWQNGAYIQNVMPQLNADQREFMISGLLPEEFDAATLPDDE